MRYNTACCGTTDAMLQVLSDGIIGIIGVGPAFVSMTYFFGNFFYSYRMCERRTSYRIVRICDMYSYHAMYEDGP